METRIHNALKQQKAKDLVHDEDVEEEEEEAVGGGGGGDFGFGEDEKPKKKSVSRRGSNGAGGGGQTVPTCQAEKCAADLKDAKRYYRRHKVCEHHSKAPVVIVAGLRQRFCQQCSRFHELLEFDEAKRSCRRRLAGHNERRRKNSSDPHAETQASKGRIL